MESVLFVFAHQDDELPVLARIRYERARGARVRCAYLTDGATSVAAAVRDAESLGVLTSVGVAAADVAFLGPDGRVPDGRLAFETGAAIARLRAYALAVPPDRIYTLDWEGGHPDHDACHLIALAVASELGVRDVLAYSLYNGFRRRPGWFRVTSLVPAPGEIVRRSLTLAEALLPLRSLARYPSQLRTWLGLGPGLAVRALLVREERFRRPDAARLSAAPHAGPLLYETMFRVPAATVLGATAELRAALARTS